MNIDSESERADAEIEKNGRTSISSGGKVGNEMFSDENPRERSLHRSVDGILRAVE